MTDNIDVTPGTGKTVATDEIGGINYQRIKMVLGNNNVNDGDVSSTNPMPVTGAFSLPTGASTEAKQDVGNTSVASIDTKTPALGQALAAASTPVVLTAAQLATLTPFSTVGAAQVGGWTVSISGGVVVSGTVAATQSGTWNIATVTTVTAVTAITNALPAGTNAIGKLAANSGVTIGAVEIAAAQTLATVTTVGAVTAITNALPAGANIIGALVADQTMNLNKIAGTAPDVNSGAKSAGTLRVVLATDQPALTNPLLSTVAGDVASGVANTGNPVQVGGLAKTANPTAVADGQRVASLHDKVGRTVIVNSIRELIGDQNTTITATTTATVIVTAAAALFLDLVSLTLTNISATGTEVQLLDDDGTTIRWVGYAPANDMRGIVFSTPFTQPTVNKSWKLKTVTSITSLKVTAQFIKNI